jgi:predicted ATP-grasp superfamily ATP-dependent carboligase
MPVRYADEAYLLGPAPSSESYLNIEKIIEVAKKSGADAIHPGYGFLSENAAFSQRCEDEGIIFIGPSPHAISSMGDKITARKHIMAAGVPVVPGTIEPITDEKAAIENIVEIGLPVMIKASAGGGGKGMRLVKRKEDILSAIRGAKSEAKTAFGDDAVYIEKYIESPHHIEFQILGDKHGNVIHLFERECSVQRRHQKVIEETPSPLMNPQIREEMGQHAIAAAKAVNYHGAGTIEFIVDDNLNYYFLEMNTRLQVEHPITERVVGVDLVKEQIKIATGRKALTGGRKTSSNRGMPSNAGYTPKTPTIALCPRPERSPTSPSPLGWAFATTAMCTQDMKSRCITTPSSQNSLCGQPRAKRPSHACGAHCTPTRSPASKPPYPSWRASWMTRILSKATTTPTSSKSTTIPSCKSQPCGRRCQDIALITAFMHYNNKIKSAKSTSMEGWRRTQPVEVVRPQKKCNTTVKPTT